MTHNIESLTNLAEEVALAAGETIAKYADTSLLKTTTKSSKVDLVTEVDHESERLIVERIRKERPDDGILGEEGTSFESRTGVQWVIDPLDGTTNFFYGIPNYAVSIGVVVDGKPACGAVYNPATSEMFTATKGAGAFLNGEPIHVNNNDDLGMSLVATGFSYSAENRTQQTSVLLSFISEIRDIRRSGAAALDICNVARGLVDAYYEIGVWPWDVTAGYVIASEAGATISGFHEELPSRDIIVACTQPVHDALRKFVVA